MFILENTYIFDADSQRCRLNYFLGYPDSSPCTLTLHSKTAHISFRDKSADASFGITISPPLERLDWRSLSGKSFYNTPSEDDSFFFSYDNYSEWDAIKEVKIAFSNTKNAEIEISARGIGKVDAFIDIFPFENVHFQIQTMVTFSGISVYVPEEGHKDPISYAKAQILKIIPSYSFLETHIRRTSVENRSSYIIEVWLPPNPKS